MINKLLLIFTLLLQPAFADNDYDYKVFSVPRKNEVATVNVGEFLLDQRAEETVKVLHVPIRAKRWNRVILPGRFYQIKSDDEFNYYARRNRESVFILENSGFFTVGNGEPVSGLLQQPKGSLKGCGAGTSKKSCNWIPLEFEKETRAATVNLRKVLLFKGFQGNTVKLSYREFAEDLARDSFTTDVEFDITSNKIIGYSSARIEIIDVSALEIKYRVLKTF
jgi:hypothetical protein